MYLKVGSEKPKKEQKLGKKVSDKTSFQVGKYRNKAEMKTHKKTTLLRNDGGKERQEDYTLHLLYVFLFRHRFQSRVVVLCVFISALFLYIFQVHPYLKGSFFLETLFPSITDHKFHLP